LCSLSVYCAIIVQILMGSGDGVVKLFDSSTSKYHWEINSDPKYPKYVVGANGYVWLPPLLCSEWI